MAIRSPYVWISTSFYRVSLFSNEPIFDKLIVGASTLFLDMFISRVSRTHKLKYRATGQAGPFLWSLKGPKMVILCGAMKGNLSKLSKINLFHAYHAPYIHYYFLNDILNLFMEMEKKVVRNLNSQEL